MGMREEFESAGNWLFRRRGYLPLLLFPLMLYGGWRSPLMRFSLLMVLRREHSSLLALVASLTALKVVSHQAITGRLTLDPRWGTALAATLLVCLAIRTLKHRTRLLHVEGR